MENLKRFEKQVGKHKLFVEGFLPQKETGAPILCIHGAFDGSWIYRRFMRVMAQRGHAAYALNIRGYYRSQYDAIAGLTVDDYLEDITAVRSDLKLEQNAILVGYSLSGPLCLAAALQKPAAGIILYDPDPPREAMKEKVEINYLKDVMKFVPGKNILEEMWGGPVSDYYYNMYRQYFELTAVSGKVFSDIEIKGLSIPPEKLTSPVLVIGTQGKNHNHAEFFIKYRANWFAFDGYSHGMILFSPYADILGRFALSWIDRGMPTGHRRFFTRTNKQLSLHAEDSFLNLTYYSGWNHAAVRILGRGNRVLHQQPLKSEGPGRKPGEKIYHGKFLVPAYAGFEIHGDNNDFDRAPGFTLYRPKGTVATLADGVFHHGPLPKPGAAPRRIDHTLRSEIMQHTYKLRVWLPRDYPLRAPYPVAVMNDGHNIWTNEGSNGGWWADRTATRLSRAGLMRDIIIVGVWPHKRRDNAYLPPPAGRGDIYLRFLVDQLIPFLKLQYQVSSVPAETAIIGASYGATAALYAGLTAPSVFGLVGSFSFPYVRGKPVEKIIEHMKHTRLRRLYLDCGTRWAHDQPHRDDYTGLTRSLSQTLQNKGMIPGFDLLTVIGEGHFHREEFWRKRLPRAFQFLFPPK